MNIGHEDMDHSVMKQKIVGWREWLLLPELGLPKIKAKIDTGAKTSCLHAFSIEPIIRNNNEWIRFGIHPHQGDRETAIYCEAKVRDKRIVTDSGGHQEKRYVITTLLKLGELSWPIEVTLTNRDTMRFRMLLGRTAMQNRLLVDPSESFLFGKPPRRPKQRKKKV